MSLPDKKTEKQLGLDLGLKGLSNRFSVNNLESLYRALAVIEPKHQVGTNYYSSTALSVLQIEDNIKGGIVVICTHHQKPNNCFWFDSKAPRQQGDFWLHVYDTLKGRGW